MNKDEFLFSFNRDENGELKLSFGCSENSMIDTREFLNALIDISKEVERND